jgi:hypothetical protein
LIAMKGIPDSTLMIGEPQLAQKARLTLPPLSPVTS